jgi:hypothetical protein
MAVMTPSSPETHFGKTFDQESGGRAARRGAAYRADGMIRYSRGQAAMEPE